jgi:hypothetical protein
MGKNDAKLLGKCIFKQLSYQPVQTVDGFGHKTCINTLTLK